VINEYLFNQERKNESKRISDEFPLIHQIAFFDQERNYSESSNSAVIREDFGAQHYRLWTLELARDLLKTSYTSEVVNAFDTLKAYAHKANIARYCIVNHFGGLYADISVSKIMGYDSGKNDMILFAEGNSSKTSWKVANSLFFSKPQSRILQDSIEQILSNVSSRYYGHDPHFIGGPSVLGRSVAKFGLEYELLIGQYYWLRYRRNKYVLPVNYVFARHKRGGLFQGGVSGLVGGNNYNHIWRDRNVYGEDN
jgi:hypothetical protein